MGSVKNISIFASGSGTNAQNIMEYFKDNASIMVDSVVTNRKDALVVQRAKNYRIPVFFIDRESFYSSDHLLLLLKERKTDLIVLAGFLWLVPENLIREFKMINIHPALLPQYGGKGMYGMKVHQAVIQNKETKSGISIHRVNEIYDDGAIIFQAECPVGPDDTAEDVAAKIHKLEYRYYPLIIEKVLSEG